MIKKILKATSVLGGLFVFSEVCGILGECQALEGMYYVYPDETGKFIDAAANADEILKDEHISWYTKFKAKIVGELAKIFIEN